MKYYLVAIFLSIALISAQVAFAEPDKPEMLVSTSWLANQGSDPNVLILHVGDAESYAAGHIPGAFHVVPEDFAQMKLESRTLEMGTATALQEYLEARGATPDTTFVVSYEDGWVPFAARVAVTLRSFGIAGQVALLDGGEAKWKREGRAITTDIPKAAQRGSLPILSASEVVVDADFVRANSANPDFLLVDARAVEFFAGTKESGAEGHKRRGRIPGARSIAFTEFTNSDATFKTPEELKRLFQKIGYEPGDTIIGYCHVGLQASVVVFAAQVSGYETRLYDGAFEDWTIRALPVER